MKYRIPYIIFEITQRCNLSCVYCYNYWRRPGYTEQQSTFKETGRTLKRIFESIDFQHITFTGGEPFLADGLKEFVLKCRMKGKGVNIISNGTSAKLSDYRTLLDLGVSLFELPLHCDSAAVHDALTCSPGSFNKVIDSIRFFVESKAKICVVCVLTKMNIASLGRTLEYAKTLGIEHFLLARYNIGGRGVSRLKDILPSLDELRSAFRIANDFVQNNKMRISANVCVPFCIINPKEYPDIPVSSCGFDPVRKPITIDFSGNMRLCNHSPHIIGNIHSETVESILTSEYVTSWKTTCPEYCLGCDRWTRCMGGCRAASEQLGYSIEKEDPVIGLLKEKPQGARIDF